jgi:hypothetical protein
MLQNVWLKLLWTTLKIKHRVGPACIYFVLSTEITCSTGFEIMALCFSTLPSFPYAHSQCLPALGVCLLAELSSHFRHKILKPIYASVLLHADGFNVSLMAWSDDTSVHSIECGGSTVSLSTFRYINRCLLGTLTRCRWVVLFRKSWEGKNLHHMAADYQCYFDFFGRSNWAPRHEGVLGSGGIAPRILWPRH